MTIKAHSLHIMLAAGGTGGHIFPAQALAECLLARGHKVTLITDSRFAAYRDNNASSAFDNIAIHTISAASLSGSYPAKLKGLGVNLLGYRKTKKIIARTKPDVVIGFGGYPSFCPMLAASRKIPTIIHEQNALLGKTNRVLASRMDVIACSFEHTGLVPKDHTHKMHYVGNPVRASIRALRDIPPAQLQDDGLMQLLVTGGSQGASIFGTIVPQAIALLPEALRRRIRIDQQVRAEQLDALRETYHTMGVQADLAAFFGDIPARLAAAHLVIGRSGASTVTELACAGRPAILVPLPTAADDHQKINAQSIEDAGGAWLIPQDAFTPQALAARLESFLTLPATLSRAAECIRNIGKPDATEKLADLVENVAYDRVIPAGREASSAPSADAAEKTKTLHARVA